MSILVLIFMFFLAIFIFFFLSKVDWWINTFRDIASDRRGYTKLVQFILLSVLLFIFVIIVGYYIINPDKVDRIDLILTVVVGWLGAIIGSFFGDKSMDTLDTEKKTNLNSLVFEYEKKDFIIKKLLEKLNKKHLKTK